MTETFTITTGKGQVHRGEFTYWHKEVDQFVDYEGDLRWQQACGFAWLVRASWRCEYTMSR